MWKLGFKQRRRAANIANASPYVHAWVLSRSVRITGTPGTQHIMQFVMCQLYAHDIEGHCGKKTNEMQLLLALCIVGMSDEL